MPIRITLGRLVDAVPALKRLSDLPLAMQACYDASKLTRLVDAETTIFTEKVAALRQQLGEDRPATEAEVAQGAPATVRDVPLANRAAFAEKLTELAAVEVTIPWKPIDLTALGSERLTPAEMNLLGVHDEWALATAPNPAEIQAEKSI